MSDMRVKTQPHFWPLINVAGAKHALKHPFRVVYQKTLRGNNYTIYIKDAQDWILAHASINGASRYERETMGQMMLDICNIKASQI